MNTHRHFKEEKRRGFLAEGQGFGVIDGWCNEGNIHVPVMMPGAGVALPVTRGSVAGMIVGDGQNDPDAHVERADDCCYPSPFHPVRHCYGSDLLLSSKIKPSSSIGTSRYDCNPVRLLITFSIQSHSLDTSAEEV